MIQKRVLGIRGDGIKRTIRLSQLDISERLMHAPRILRFPDGAFIEVRDPSLNKMLAANRYRDPWVVRWQQNWALSLLALVTLIVSLISAYQWGLPVAADKLAQHLPAALENKIGDAGLAQMDAHMLKPSKLDMPDQARLQGLFAALKQPRGEKTAYRLEFRSGAMGANAFALPNGVIVMTDDLVKLAGNDQAILGVLAHELGHVQRRHFIRGLLQTVGVGIVLNLVVGDVSTALAAAPTFLLDQKYSRDLEREADLYAIEMMHANGQSLEPMAALFEKMRAEHGDAKATPDAQQYPENADDDEEDGDTAPQQSSDELETAYFSSHPSDTERIARLRAADRKP